MKKIGQGSATANLVFFKIVENPYETKENFHHNPSPDLTSMYHVETPHPFISPPYLLWTCIQYISRNLQDLSKYPVNCGKIIGCLYKVRGLSYTVRVYFTPETMIEEFLYFLPSASTSFIMSVSSASEGFCPSDLITVPSSLFDMVPSPSLSNSEKASLNSASQTM